jgi:toxin YoeB
LTKPARSLEFDAAAFEDLAWWAEQDRNKAARIIKLIMDIQRDPFHGLGKPEPLKRELSGCWSRRIDPEHRLVYQVTDKKIRILACRYHY